MDNQEKLFDNVALQDDIWALLKSEPGARASIAYVGPIVGSGRMDAALVADGLKGTARFVNRIAEMYFGNSAGFQFEVEGEPATGSLQIFVRFGHEFVDAVRQIGDSKFLTGLAIIATLSGFTARDAGKSIIALFKKLHGQPIREGQNLIDVIPPDLPIEVAEFIRIFNDPEVQRALRAALRPLRAQGIEKYETRLGGKTIESVTKSELVAADSADLEAVIPDEDLVLGIEKASFVPHLAWHFSDQGKPFDATIADQTLWDAIAAGDRFGYGDKLHVTLHSQAEFRSNGKLRITRTVTKVHRVERYGGVQESLFPSVTQSDEDKGSQR